MVNRGDKRGSHVGVVISFAIFITFVVFLYTMAHTVIKEEQTEESIMPILEKILIKNASSELTIITVNITNYVGSRCIELTDFTTDFGIDDRIVAWNQEQVSTPCGADNHLRLDRLDSGDSFFKIYYSEEFNYKGSGSFFPCQSLSEGSDYDLGITRVENYVFESKIFDLMNQYTLWYEAFKGDLGIPRSFEFGFGLIYNNGSIIETQGIEISKNVYIQDVPIQYVNRNGEIESGFLRLKTW